MFWVKVFKQWFCNDLKIELKSKKTTILELNDSIYQKDSLISKLRRQVVNLASQVERLRSDLSAFKVEKFKHAITNVKELFDESDLKPTQKDKPSAHSSLELKETYKKIKNTYPEPNYRLFSVTNTNSMEPFIDYNSLVITEKIRYSILQKQPLGIGDICIYEGTIRGRQVMIIHRIKKINNDKSKYYFLGDNNFFGDGWITLKNIKYRYCGQIQTLRLKKND